MWEKLICLKFRFRDNSPAKSQTGLPRLQQRGKLNRLMKGRWRGLRDQERVQDQGAGFFERGFPPQESDGITRWVKGKEEEEEEQATGGC